MRARLVAIGRLSDISGWRSRNALAQSTPASPLAVLNGWVMSARTAMSNASRRKSVNDKQNMAASHRLDVFHQFLLQFPTEHGLQCSHLHGAWFSHEAFCMSG